MLLSENKKFIFVHIPKNAGQSITSTLIKYCISDKEKIVTNLIGVRNYIKVNSKLKQYLKFSFYSHQFQDHEKAYRIKETLGSSYNSYFKFAFVRNPWDWIFSHYTYTLKNVRHYRHKFVKDNFDNFNEYVEYECLHKRSKSYNQNNFIFDSSGAQIVDFIGKFENINNDFQAICDKLEIDEKIPHFNQSNKVSYKQHYSERSKDLVRDLYLRDIELFDYKF
jgi:hypothetical protein